MTPEQQKLLEQLAALDNQGDAGEEPTKAKLIIKAFAEMNITALEIFLDDAKTYQNATKEVFLEKLAASFISRKENGDTYFNIYSGQCGADNRHCENCGKTGYRFVGNDSNNYFDFIFEIDSETVSDIYDCSRFESDETIENLNNQEELFFEIDEHADFVKTPEYIIKVNAAEKAFSEISTTPPQLLDFEQLGYWIDKNAVLYESVGEYDVFDSRFKWTPFASLYCDLKKIKEYLYLNFKPIQNANEEYKTLQTEQNYIDWLEKYYTVFDPAPSDLQYGLTLEKSVVNCFITINTTILFLGQELSAAYHFFKNYNIKNKELLKKYCVYNDEEYWEKFNDFDFKDDLSNLNYHLQQRKALAKIGVEIPFYIIKNRF